jgi:16S rRNA processing protein RimM
MRAHPVFYVLDGEEVPKQNEKEWATIGKVVALFGLQGELKVRSLSDIPNRFTELHAVYCGDSHVRHIIESVRPYKGEMLLLKLKGFDDATSAEKLRNADLTIPLSDLANLPPDSYYQHDIIGLRVFTLNDKVLGTIVDIIVTGSNDVYVIKAENGTQQLIPAIKDVVKQIDLIRHTMHIDPIPGLLDNSDEQEREEEDASRQERE